MREPEFNDRDRARLLADYDDAHEQRSSTGLPASVAFDPANEGNFKVRRVLDFAAAQLAREKDAFTKQYGKDFDLSSYRWAVELDEG